VQVETLTYNDRHRVNQKITVGKKEKSSRFAFLKISASTHLQFSIHTGKHPIPKLQEILFLPTNKGQANFHIFASILNTL